MTMLGEATASYVARLPRRSGPEPMAMASGERQSSRRKTMPPQPEICPLCNGAGYVRLDVPVGHPDFGRAVQCQCKEREIAERERLKLRAVSSLKPFDKKTFSTFDPSIPGVREAHEVALRYAEDPVGWLIFQGGYGCGKTHLAAAIAHQREDEGDTVFFSIVPDLLDHLRAAFAPTSELTYDALFERVRESGLLVLDDLGAENGTAWATEKLFQLINYRYNYRMPTVITTNARLMSHMDERIRSRLNDRGLVRYVQIEAQDYRERHAGRPVRGSGGTRGRGGYTRQ
jgi:DNA replication protein DnaC